LCNFLPVYCYEKSKGDDVDMVSVTVSEFRPVKKQTLADLVNLDCKTREYFLTQEKLVFQSI
jgi:hypothetical protein